MVSAAQIAYPTCEDESKEDDEEQDIEPVLDDDVDEQEDENGNEGEEGGNTEEDVRAGVSRSEDYHHRESGRYFDVSPEEFCADPYEQQGNYDTRMELGRRGEEAAVKYLISKGYEILKRNWFCHFGEADIIARDPDGTLCFIEVKTRRSIEAGLPEEAITPSKRRRYERIACAFMMVSDDWDDNDNVRFDAICICVTGPHRAMLRHHMGCFNAGL